MTRDTPLDLTYEEPPFEDKPKGPAFQMVHDALTGPETIQANETLRLGLLKYSPGLPLVQWLNDYATNTHDGRLRFSYSATENTITVTKAI